MQGVFKTVTSVLYIFDNVVINQLKYSIMFKFGKLMCKAW